MKKSIFTAFTLSLLIAQAVCAHTQSDDNISSDKEKSLAHSSTLTGPTKSEGITAVKKLGSIMLADEIKDASTKILRAREIIVAPGGKVAIHQHDARPGVAYIVEGEIYEHRSDSDKPLLRKAGMVAFEKTGLTHWWENKSDKPVKAVVVDIVDQPATK